MSYALENSATLVTVLHQFLLAANSHSFRKNFWHQEWEPQNLTTFIARSRFELRHGSKIYHLEHPSPKIGHFSILSSNFSTCPQWFDYFSYAAKCQTKIQDLEAMIDLFHHQKQPLPVLFLRTSTLEDCCFDELITLRETVFIAWLLANCSWLQSFDLHEPHKASDVSNFERKVQPDLFSHSRGYSNATRSYWLVHSHFSVAFSLAWSSFGGDFVTRG